jgi:hypothetical protein
MVETGLVVIYEYGRRYVHGVHQAQAFADPALLYQFFDRVRDVYETPSIRNFKPKMFCQRLHAAVLSSGFRREKRKHVGLRLFLPSKCLPRWRRNGFCRKKRLIIQRTVHFWLQNDLILGRNEHFHREKEFFTWM